MAVVSSNGDAADRTGDGVPADSDFTALTSQARVDALLAEAQERFARISESRRQLAGLMESMLDISSGLDLQETLRSVVRSAMGLVGARYGAVGVRADDGRLSAFVHEGIDAESGRRIGPLPTGSGLLGEFMHRPEVMVLRHIADHPASTGFPPHHPPMTTFLGAPIVIHGQVFGTIYLTEKHDGAAFTADDEAVIRALAAAAATAVDNARLYQQLQTRVRWIEATRDVVTGLLAEDDTTTVFQRLADALQELTGAALTFIALPDDTDPEVLSVIVAAGETSGEVVGSTIPIDGSTSGRAVRERATLRVEHLQYSPMELSSEFGPALVAPLRSGDDVTGVLVSLRRTGMPGFDQDMSDLVTSFADHAALGLSLAESRVRERQFHVLADRDRIARDLHDHVIQRIFAAGLSLRAIAQTADDLTVGDRLTQTIDDLQDVIQDIRGTIFDLHADPDAAPGLLTRTRSAVAELAAGAGVVVVVRSSGPLSAIDPTTAEHVLAVVREGVSNVVRHSGAERAVVTIAVADQVTVTVSDNGAGGCEAHAPSRDRHGLRNMRARAADVGGTLAVVPSDEGGTRIIWTAPLV